VTDGVDLVVIGYPDEATAEKAYEVVVQLQHDLIMQVAGAAVVAKDADGKAKMVTKTGATSSGAFMAASSACSSASSFWSRGRPDHRRNPRRSHGHPDRLGHQGRLPPAVAGCPQARYRSARPLCQEVDRGQGPGRPGPLGGEVLKTSLSDEATKEINAALEAD